MSIIEMPVQVDLAGHSIMLNLEKCRRFQCPGFALSFNTPCLIVPTKASMNGGTFDVMVRAIQAGLIDGRLMDVTDQAKAGLKVGGNEHTAVKAEDTELPKVLMGQDAQGRLYVVTPKDKDHEAALIKEIQDTGTLKSVNFNEPGETTGITKIKVEDTTPTIIVTDLE